MQGEYSPAKQEAKTFGSELEYKLNYKKAVNRKWMIYLTCSSIITTMLIAVIAFFAIDINNVRPKEDECGVVFAEENLKIIHGDEAVPHSWPAQVLLEFSYYVGNYSFSNISNETESYPLHQGLGSSCGGTLINRWTVMTASHCIMTSMDAEIEGVPIKVPVEPNEFFPTYESMYTIYVGLHGSSDRYKFAKKHHVRKIIKHEGHNDVHALKDITLLKLEKKVELNSAVQIACLPKNQSDNYPAPGTKAYAVGWGRTSANHSGLAKKLQNAVLTIANDSLCKRRQGRTYDPASKVCAGDFTARNASVNHGDSGGSIYVKEVIGNKVKFVSVGIASYILADYGDLQYFTRVSHYLDWIKSHLDE